MKLKNIHLYDLEFRAIFLDFIDYLQSAELPDASRLKSKSFTHQRTLTFPILLAAMMAGFKASVQNELNAFFAHLANQADLQRHVTAQAFSKARKQFSHTAFTKLNQRLMQQLSSRVSVPRWNGLRVVAADASKMRLHLQDVSHRFVREAIAFALYLPGVEMTLSAEFYHASVGERQMLFEHLFHLDAIDLLALDRGYPARLLIAHLSQRSIVICMRVDQTGLSGYGIFYAPVPTSKSLLFASQISKIVSIISANRSPLPALDSDCHAEWSSLRRDDLLT